VNARTPTPRERIAALGLELPSPSAPTASYVSWVQTGNLLFLAGHNPYEEGEIRLVGKVGRELTLEQGQRCAQIVALNLLATLELATGDLGRIRRIVKLLVFVNSDPSFTEQHLVANGASDLLAEVFGPDVAPHARSAVGMASLPFDMGVEIEMIAELEGKG
jgi:enamine deaminase RidA (YjgF/YER057c/UK114 family)